mgnify:CR=1 FL=1
MKIYTKTGDNGETSLVGGIRVSKCDIRLEAYGTIDELNAFLGLMHAELTDKNIQKFILNIQNNMFVIDGYLATDTTKKTLPDSLQLPKGEVLLLEKAIDKLSSQLLSLKGFVVPGTNRVSALCHVCRSIARRAERNIYVLEKETMISVEIKKYINRLSDYLFVLARFVEF